MAFLDPLDRIPDIVRNLAEDTVSDHHASAAGLVMIKPDEATVTVFCVEVRPVARQNVGMKIDLHAWNCMAFLRNANGEASDTDALQ